MLKEWGRKTEGSRVVRERVARMKLKRRHGPELGGNEGHEEFLSICQLYEKRAVGDRRSCSIPIRKPLCGVAGVGVESGSGMGDDEQSCQLDLGR